MIIELIHASSVVAIEVDALAENSRCIGVEHFRQGTGNRYEEACAHEGVDSARLKCSDARAATVHWQQTMELYDQLGVLGSDRVRERLDALQQRLEVN
ncbi:hypothetical protein GCM10017567_31720 [Amycolatopsis bullii]|uniref:Uncharacterized protein n=1 Tax=Amycolatopsis bullii TaxID=941987 RepID=A0ABQ3KBU0_9PSEU|nr:hypothetical protein GCM10017567_31720 [Amycolatopsis bullii]